MRKYLHWGETREVPKAPIPTLTPLNSFDTPLYPSPKPERSIVDGEIWIEEHGVESDAAREAGEQSRRVMEKRHKGR